MADKSAEFWANAFTGSSFLPQGDKFYMNSGFYKNSGWRDLPAQNPVPVTDEQIQTFTQAYLSKAQKSIDEWLKSDIAIAVILGLKNRLSEADRLGCCPSYCFGGYRHEPTGAVKVAMEAAGITGVFSVRSSFHPYTSIVLRNGNIFRSYK